MKDLLHAHRHHPAERVDRVLESSERGIRAVKLSLLGLGATALLQLFVLSVTNSVALLGDTLHNFGDALTAVPLWLAFSIGRRSPNRRYTHGYGRGEDIAGIAIVVTIAVSAVIAGFETFSRLIDPEDVERLPLVMLAAVIGFAGNEAVALYRIRIGRAIGSAALVADGLHARTDGFTSLAVLAGSLGVAAGYEVADPIAGGVITLAIVLVLKNAARDVYYRLMDAVDPALVDRIEEVLAGVDGVAGIDGVRVRWIGHQLRAEVDVTVDGSLSVVEAHDIAEHAHHSLLHDVERLTSAIVHTNPSGGDRDHHGVTAHHFPEGS
ncbi:MAG: cation diffusion facilitator family transporter [Actinomycetota bacterium]